MSWDGSPPLGLISYLACGGALWIRLLAVTLILKKCQLLVDQKKKGAQGIVCVICNYRMLFKFLYVMFCVLSLRETREQLISLLMNYVLYAEELMSSGFKWAYTP